MQILSWSGGKDSTASILLCLEHGIQIDKVLYAQLWFDEKKKIPADDPEHFIWVTKKAIPYIEAHGLEVVVVSRKDYISGFTAKVVRGPRKGKTRGYPLGPCCWFRRDSKVRAIEYYLRDHLPGDHVQIIGIAADEPKRLKALPKNARSVLAEFGVTEAEAMELCRAHDLLSPVYDRSFRGGCWFCPNAKREELLYIKEHYPTYWAAFTELAKTPELVSLYWQYNKTVSQIEKELRE